MECLEAIEVIGNPLREEAKYAESLRRAVLALHDKKLVFGDLREPNILITKDGLRLVDFDCSGEEGTVYYPVDISSGIQWPNGVGGGGKIKAEHDKAWFKQLTGTAL